MLFLTEAGGAETPGIEHIDNCIVKQMICIRERRVDALRSKILKIEYRYVL